MYANFLTGKAIRTCRKETPRLAKLFPVDPGHEGPAFYCLVLADGHTATCNKLVLVQYDIVGVLLFVLLLCCL